MESVSESNGSLPRENLAAPALKRKETSRFFLQAERISGVLERHLNEFAVRQTRQYGIADHGKPDS